MVQGFHLALLFSWLSGTQSPSINTWANIHQVQIVQLWDLRKVGSMKLLSSLGTHALATCISWICFVSYIKDQNMLL
jgi:hypothetical protein